MVKRRHHLRSTCGVDEGQSREQNFIPHQQKQFTSHNRNTTQTLAQSYTTTDTKHTEYNTRSHIASQDITLLPYRIQRRRQRFLSAQSHRRVREMVEPHSGRPQNVGDPKRKYDHARAHRLSTERHQETLRRRRIGQLHHDHTCRIRIAFPQTPRCREREERLHPPKQAHLRLASPESSDLRNTSALHS